MAMSLVIRSPAIGITAVGGWPGEDRHVGGPGADVDEGHAEVLSSSVSTAWLRRSGRAPAATSSRAAHALDDVLGRACAPVTMCTDRAGRCRWLLDSWLPITNSRG
jgi:hypothetical protein